MSLVKCKECDKEISKSAKACPNCGSKPKRTSLFTWLVAIVAIPVVIGFINTDLKNTSGKSEATPRQKTPDELRYDRNLQRAAAGAKTLKQNMRNPKSFDLASAIAMQSNAICFEYRAQNGFGGMNVEQAVLLPDGKQFLTTSMRGFDRAWQKHCAGKTGNEMKSAVRLYL